MSTVGLPDRRPEVVNASTDRARQSVYLIVGRVLATLSEAIVPITLVRLLPKEEVGILSAIWMIYAILAPIFSASFPAIVMYFVPASDAREKRDVATRIALSMLGLSTIASLLMIGLGSVAIVAPSLISALTEQVVDGVSALGPSGLQYLAVFGLIPLGDIPSRMLPNLLITEGRAKSAAVWGFVKSMGTAACTLVPLLITTDLWWVVISLTVFRLSYGLLIPYYLKTLYPGPGQIRTTVCFGELFAFAVPLGITEAVMSMYNKIDLLLISTGFSAALYAEYQIGAWQIPVVTTIAYSVGAVHVPIFTRLFKEGKYREGIAMWRETIEKVSLVSVPVGLFFVVCADETISLLFTDAYERAVTVFRLYCLLVVGRVTGFGSVVVAAGKPKLNLQAGVFSLASNVAFSLPLMAWMGFDGPAVGTVLAFAAHSAFFCYCIARATGVRFSETFPLTRYLRVLVVGGAASLICFIVKWCLGGPALLVLLVSAVVQAVTFSVLGTLTGLITKNDWRFVAQWFEGLKKKR